MHFSLVSMWMQELRELRSYPKCIAAVRASENDERRRRIKLPMFAKTTGGAEFRADIWRGPN